ncbi:hypothetical protein LZ32DRAFT_45255 [Colletotrichum eremochloae]|nr:hypothetical protein LZ32DRAFT_45255 [Colletotrichum eremochloae]
MGTFFSFSFLVASNFNLSLSLSLSLSLWTHIPVTPWTAAFQAGACETNSLGMRGGLIQSRGGLARLRRDTSSYGFRRRRRGAFIGRAHGVLHSMTPQKPVITPPPSDSKTYDTILQRNQPTHLVLFSPYQNEPPPAFSPGSSCPDLALQSPPCVLATRNLTRDRKRGREGGFAWHAGPRQDDTRTMARPTSKDARSRWCPGTGEEPQKSPKCLFNGASPPSN